MGVQLDSSAALQADAIAVTPVRRDLHFRLPAERIGDWHDAGRQVSHFFNALSLFFPDGERFFIQSVRHYRERIQDPELQRAVAGFIGQEAMHTREHLECNGLLDRAGLPGAALQARVHRLLEHVKQHVPASTQLAITIALEHLTALMGESLLRDARVVGDAEAHFARMWRWHALEETEHKAVAYDVWCALMPRGPLSYLHRTGALLLATALFWPLVIAFTATLIRADAQARQEPHGLRKLLRYHFRSPAPLPRLIGDWLAYFKPGFHPWQQDNRHYLAGIEPLLAELEAAAKL